MSRPRISTEERFWSKVEKTEKCWNWTGSTARGYGQFRNELLKMEKAHRYSYRLHKGEIPTDLFVLHSCDNPKCCNPEHLRLGTLKENSLDAVARGRISRLYGVSNPMYGKTGALNPMYGKPGGFKGRSHTKETRDKISEANKRTWATTRRIK
jgi:hypothetical protein